MTIDSERQKEEGNKCFKDGDYCRAIVHYNSALSSASVNGVTFEEILVDSDLPRAKEAQVASPNLTVYLNNRAMCNLRLENYGSAIVDASNAILLDPRNAKSYYRRGCAKVALGRYSEALKDFGRVLEIVPGDVEAALRQRECRKKMQELAFAKAISVDKKTRLSDSIILAELDVPTVYDGPRYDGAASLTQDTVNSILDHMKEQRVLPKRFAYAIVLDAIALFKKQEALVTVHEEVKTAGKFTVFGDIHGQYYDLLNILKTFGMPGPSNPMLFNGDFVDRGSFSVECILALLLLKLLNPSHMFLSRGNHETKAMNGLYGFEGEVVEKYDVRLYGLFSELFCLLPLAHVIGGKIFVVHGGLFGRDGVTLKDIRAIDRDCEPPMSGLMSDMLWSDPSDLQGRHPSKRGNGLAFGADVTEKFLRDNDLQMVIRSHEVKSEGYEVTHGGKLVTVFSAPNYCDQMRNLGAAVVLKFPSGVGQEVSVSYESFSWVDHPKVPMMAYANRGIFGSMMGF